MSKKQAPQNNSSTTPEQKAILRRKCQTDLYWLCKEVLGYKDMVEHVHKRICETYVRKNPDKGIFEQDETKLKMVLAPRGTFKTCVDIGDVIQWVLCFPNVRVLILTGRQDLAWRMIREIKQHFQTNATLRELFPEFCPPKDSKWGTDDEFTTPARNVIRREPTVSSSTIASVNAGSHFEVIKPDDCQNEINSSTPDQCLKVIEAFDGLEYLLEPGGYIEINGTRYKSYDLYGRLLEREAAARIEWEADPDQHEAYVSDLKFTILPAWTVKLGRQISRDENGTMILRKDDVDLLFPERLKFRDLYKKYRKNPSAFACQMLNDPLQVTGDERPFTDQLIELHTIPYTQMPHPATCRDFIMWDLAGVNQENKSSIDFSVGVIGRLTSTGRLYLIDMVRGKWNATQLASQIVALAKNYPTADFTWIEDAQGARMLEPTIHGIAAQCATSVRIEWVKVPRFAGAKRYRIDGLAQFLRADKLWIAAFLPHRDALKAELLDKNPIHDDCSDAVSLLVKELGMTAGVLGKDGLPAIDKKAIANRMFEAAIYGDDDTYVETYTEPTPETPQTYTAGILGYGFAP